MPGLYDILTQAEDGETIAVLGRESAHRERGGEAADGHLYRSEAVNHQP